MAANAWSSRASLAKAISADLSVELAEATFTPMTALRNRQGVQERYAFTGIDDMGK